MKIKIFDDNYFMNEALKEAKKAYEKDEVPVGAVIVCNNTIIARAHNLSETLNDATAHAEMQAFTAASNTLGSKYLDQCTMYVTLEPCYMCAGATFWTKINEIVFAARDKKNDSLSSSKKRYHPKTKIRTGPLKKECSQLLSSFFKRKR